MKKRFQGRTDLDALNIITLHFDKRRGIERVCGIERVDSAKSTRVCLL